MSEQWDFRAIIQAAVEGADKVISDLAEIQKGLDKTTEAGRGLERHLSNQQKSLTKTTKALQDYTGASDADAKKLEKSLGGLAGEAKKSTKEYSALGEQIYTLAQNYSRLEAAASKASANMQTAMRSSSQYYKDASAGAEALARNLEKTFGSTTGGYQPTTFGKIANEGAEAAKRTAQYYQDASQSAARLASNLEKTFGPQGTGGYRPSTFGQLFGDDYRATEQASRGYLNLSTAIDSSIDARHRESAAFSQSLRARLQEEQSNNRLLGQLIPLRYALYDVATTFGAAGVIMGGAVALTVKSAIDFERSFADVARTSGVTGSALTTLRGQFEALAQAIPVSFAELTQIGTLAGQFNIAASDLASFTSVVARFASTTDMTVDASATAIARLAQLLPGIDGNFEALASSILKVGVNSVATESQIVNTATNIVGIGKQSGLSADQIIGLSAALASVGIPPELSRGLITRLFTNIQMAVAGGGQALEDFGRVSGMTAAEFASAWKTDAGSALLALLEGIERSGGSVATLRALGITAARDVPSLQKLAQSADMVAEAFGYASTGLEDATELATQYAVIAETVSAKLQVLGNNFQVLMATIGAATTGPLADFIDFLNSALVNITAFARTDVGQTISIITLAVAGLVAALGGLVATGALAGASIAAVATAMKALGVSAVATANAIRAFKIALISTGIGAAVVALGVLVEVVLAAGGAFTTAADRARSYFGDLTALGTALRRDTEIYNRTGQAIYTIADAQGAAKDATEAATIAYGENARAALAAALAGNEQFQNLIKDWDKITAGSGVDQKTFVQKLLGDPEEAKRYIQELKAEFERDLASSTSSTGFGGALGAFIDVERTFGPLERALDAVSGAVSGTAAELQAFQLVSQVTGISVGELTGDIEGQERGLGSLTDRYGDLISQLFAIPNGVASAQSALSSMGQEFALSGAYAALSGQGLQQYISAVLATAPSAEGASIQLQALRNSLVQTGVAASATAPELQYLNQVISTLGAKSVTNTTLDLSSFTAGIAKATQSTGGFADEVDDASGSVDDLAKSLRTTSDYANDLRGVLDRAFDLQFGIEIAEDSIQDALDGINQTFRDNVWLDLGNALDRQGALDSISSGWRDIRDRIRDARIELNQLTAARDVKRYFLSVANQYGDTLRAGVLRGEIAELNAEIADTAAEASTSTKGNTKAAIGNRKALSALEQEYEGYIQTLLDSDLPLSEISKKTQDLIRDFEKQATSIGYTTSDIRPYIDRLGGIKRNLDANAISYEGNSKAARANRDALRGLVSANADWAVAMANSGKSIREIREGLAGLSGKQKEFLAGVTGATTKLSGYKKGIDSLNLSFSGMRQIVQKIPRDVDIEIDVNKSPAENAINEFKRKLDEANKKYNDVRKNIKNNPIQINTPYVPKAQYEAIQIPNEDRSLYNRLLNAGQINGYIQGTTWYKYLGTWADGGYTGRGGKYQVAGVVHRGEYVIPKEHVNQRTGLPYPDALGRPHRGSPNGSYANGGYVRGLDDSGITELGPRTLRVMETIFRQEIRAYVTQREVTEAVDREHARRGLTRT